ncbi:site-specific integrase [Parafrankia sp. Ea1.12]|uniref:site-specific integrase n=1 Tax=Parafrankia sp. Ea1.12 TaxID=573499 RepID=UPI000DD496ED|nr:site-specific integrase [Parafrankia sp. Ea1.12]
MANPNGSISKRCGCREPQTRRLLGNSCPKLRRKNGAWRSDHGSWQYRVDLPPAPDGRRQEARRAGLDTRDAAVDEIKRIQDLIVIPGNDSQGIGRIRTLILDAIKAGDPLPDPEVIKERYRRRADLNPKITVADWLHTWLAGRRTIRRSTREGYEISIRLHLVPFIGDIRLDQLTIGHLDDMFDKIDARNETIRRIRAGKNPELREAFKGRKVTSDAYKQRIRATLRAALNHAIRIGLIAFNPASWVELPSGKRPRALLWTKERVARWRGTGEIPSPVMVWTPAQTGAFLDHAEAQNDRYYELFHLIAHRGPRRGEACGIHWTDLDLDEASLTIRWQITQHGADTEMGAPKSDAGDRQISLDTATVTVLRQRRARQNAHRLSHGEQWIDNGLVFTEPNGAPLIPDEVTKHFKELVAAADLPPVRLHDLRHGAATLALAAGADMKAVQDLLGHAGIGITADTYAHILPELAREVAENVARLIPRKKTGPR